MKLITVTIFFSLVLTTSFAQPVIEWQKCLGGSGADIGNTIIKTVDGHFVVAGWTTSNDSDVSGNHSASSDLWIVKLDSSSNMEWQKCLGGAGPDGAHAILETSDYGYCIAGFSSAANGDVSSNYGGMDFWVVKTDSAGNIIWEKSYGGSADDRAYSIIQTIDGGYLVTGYTASNDSDVTFNHGDWDYWLLKIDSIGNLEWEKSYGGSITDIAHEVIQTNDNGFVIVGESLSNNGDITGNHGSFDYWVVKTDSVGTLEWERSLGGSEYDYGYCVIESNNNSIVVAGISSSNDGDVSNTNNVSSCWAVQLDSMSNIIWEKAYTEDYGAAVKITNTPDYGYMLSGDDGINCYFLKIDFGGNRIWSCSLGGSAFEASKSLIALNNNELIAVGTTNSNDGNVSGNHGSADYWIVKFTYDYNQMTGKLFVDLNSNLLYDSLETLIPHYKLNETNTGQFIFSRPGGSYLFAIDDTGNYSITADSATYYNILPAAHSASFAGTNQIDSLNDFAFQPTGVYSDLSATISSYSPFRPGFNAYYSIDYKNVGTTALGGDVIFFPDSNLAFVTSYPVPLSVSTDSIVWNTATLSPFEGNRISIAVNVNSGALAGSIINSSIRFEPVNGDADTVNNFSDWPAVVIGPVDPNMILVNRSILYTNEISNPPFLDYVIYFQNTGTDTAFNVKVFNTIDTNKLDLSSFEFVASSHPVSLNYHSLEHKMEFMFDNILLPDSNVNESNSHGFIRYRIKPLNTLVAGDSIKNTAFIYFDYNQPVQTNTAVTIITLPSGVPQWVNNSGQLTIFPNPSSDELTISGLQSEVHAAVYDVFGKVILSKKLTTTNYKLQIAHFSQGIYFIEIRDGEKIFRNKFVKE